MLDTLSNLKVTKSLSPDSLHPHIVTRQVTN